MMLVHKLDGLKDLWLRQAMNNYIHQINSMIGGTGTNSTVDRAYLDVIVKLTLDPHRLD